MASPLSEPEFERVADAELHRLVDAVIAVGEDVDADLQSGVLSIQFADGGKYVVNSHRAARQIWLAAERNAWHFDYAPDARAWRTPKGDELWATVTRVLTSKLGRPVTL